MATFIGIDLGTTYSAVGMIDETGRPKIVHNPDGGNITPSCVLIEDRNIEVGEFARRTWSADKELAAARFKRDMGTSVTHTVGAQIFTPTELSTFVLKKLVQDAEKSIGPVGEVVVTIPANCAHEARDATLSAAKAAGLNVKFIINEPTAAALFYAFKSGEQLSGTYAVYDLGGGTFDVSIIRVNGYDIEVLASDGVARLGGDDFDLALRRIVARKYKDAAGEDMDPSDYDMDKAEQDKKALSGRKQVLAYVGRQRIELTREEFEEAISAEVTKAEMVCKSILDEAGIESGTLKGIFLAGGSTRIPLVRESVQRVFKREPTDTVNVDEVVALGAALYAAYKGDRSKLSSAQRHSIEKIKVSEATSKSFGTISIRHDEARDEMRRVNSILIRKGEKIPCSVEESFYTVHDGQDSVNCRVTESNAADEPDPRFVKIIWQGDLELPSGRPANQEIRITYAYDENQIMKCSFKDVATGRETKIDLSLAAADKPGSPEIDKFIVE